MADSITIDVTQPLTNVGVNVTQPAIGVNVEVKTGILGVPLGGYTGQVLVKASGSDYDFEWSSLPSILTDIIVEVDFDEQTVFELPEEWEGKRIRVSIGGPDTFSLFAKWVRTETGFDLLGGNAGEVGQSFYIENY